MSANKVAAMFSESTDITLVIDRSGSMQTRRSDAEGGINAFIKEQRDLPGEATLTLVQFDTEYEIIHDGVSLKDVPEYQLRPRGMTALLDAVGNSINTVSGRIDGLKKKKRPELVVFVIVTDGMENASKEFTRDQIKELVQARRDKGWEFVFLGADDSAFTEAGAMGMSLNSTAKYSEDNYQGVYAIVSDTLSRTRRGDRATLSFTDSDRKNME